MPKPGRKRKTPVEVDPPSADHDEESSSAPNERPKTQFFPEKPQTEGEQHKSLDTNRVKQSKIPLCCGADGKPTDMGALKAAMRAARAKQEKARELKENEEEDEKQRKEMEALLAPLPPVAVRNSSILATEMTKEEAELVKQRVAAQQKQMQEYERRRIMKKVARIRVIHPWISDPEGAATLKQCGGDEDEAAAKLSDMGFVHDVRKQVAQEAMAAAAPTKQMPLMMNFLSGGDSHDSAGEPHPVRRPRKNKLAGNAAKKVRGKNEKRPPRMRLDDALKQAEKTGSMDGWSQARIRAYQLVKENPNAYYYRFNDPGVAQKNGKWSKDEEALFFKRMEEVGVNGQWGIFSMTIPGRVGYQCSNFYRHLLQTGRVKDANYTIDDKGKLHYAFGKAGTSRKGRRPAGDKDKDDDGEEGGEREDASSTAGTTPIVVKAPKKKRTRKSRKDDEDEAYDDDDRDYRPSTSKDDEDEMLEKKRSENPLRGFIDPITMEEIDDPWISPQGYVMGKTTWSRCLQQEPRNTCPFTKQLVHKRDLVQLTWANIEQFKSKIVNWSLADIPLPKSQKSTEKAATPAPAADNESAENNQC